MVNLVCHWPGYWRRALPAATTVWRNRKLWRIHQNRSLTAFLLLSGLLCAQPLIVAQDIELGGTLGKSLDAPADVNSTVGGLQIGAWWRDSLETAFRLVLVDLPNTISIGTYFLPTGTVRVAHHWTGKRRFMAGQALYHFRRGSTIRPFAGVGIGGILESDQLSCEIAGCELLLPDERFGTRTHSHGYFVSSGGLSVMIANHVVVRGGIHFHNVPGGEERAFVETSVQVGYRFNPW